MTRRPAPCAAAPARTLAAAGGLAAVLAAGAGCFGERERLDAPRVRLDLATTTVAPRGSVEGVVTAVDRSGVIRITVSARSGDSVDTEGFDFIRGDSVTVPFLLGVADDASVGSDVVVVATAIDNQLFTVSVSDTVRVR